MSNHNPYTPCNDYPKCKNYIVKCEDCRRRPENKPFNVLVKATKDYFVKEK